MKDLYQTFKVRFTDDLSPVLSWSSALPGAERYRDHVRNFVIEAPLLEHYDEHCTHRTKRHTPLDEFLQSVGARNVRPGDISNYTEALVEQLEPLLRAMPLDHLRGFRYSSRQCPSGELNDLLTTQLAGILELVCPTPFSALPACFPQGRLSLSICLWSRTCGAEAT